MRTMFRLALAALLSLGLFGCGSGATNTNAKPGVAIVKPTLVALDLVEATVLPTTTINNTVAYVSKTDTMLLFQQLTAVARGGYDPGLIVVEVTDTVTGLTALDTQCSTAGGHAPYNTAIFFVGGLYKVQLMKNNVTGANAEMLGECFVLIKSTTTITTTPYDLVALTSVGDDIPAIKDVDGKVWFPVGTDQPVWFALTDKGKIVSARKGRGGLDPGMVALQIGVVGHENIAPSYTPDVSNQFIVRFHDVGDVVVKAIIGQYGGNYAVMAQCNVRVALSKG